MIRRIVGLGIFASALAFGFAGSAQTPNCSLASQFYAKDSIEITTFGASTVQGVGGVGFQGYLRKDIEHCYVGKTISVYNYGIAGETTAQGLRRIDEAIAGKKGFFFLLMGANDALAIAKDGRIKISDTEQNVRAMVKKCLAAKLVVVIGTLQAINSNTASDKRANLVINQLNAIYKDIANEYKLQVADINHALARNFKLYADAIHPNNRGYQVLALVWFDALNRAIESNFLELYVSQNFPNPTTDGTTSIIYTVPEPGKVQLFLYNLNGKMVRLLVDEYENAGIYTRTFDLSELASGMYIYQFITGSKHISRKMLVSR